MILHRSWCWVHIPKCAGRSILQGLVDYPGVHSATFGHVPAPLGYPVLAFVRNPWDYYVALYCHLQNEPMFRRLVEHGFSASIERAIAAGASLSEQLRQLARWGSDGTTVCRIEDGVQSQLNQWLQQHSEGPEVALRRLGHVERAPDARYNESDLALVRSAELDVIAEFDYPDNPAQAQLALPEEPS